MGELLQGRLCNIVKGYEIHFFFSGALHPLNLLRRGRVMHLIK